MKNEKRLRNCLALAVLAMAATILPVVVSAATQAPPLQGRNGKGDTSGRGITFDVEKLSPPAGSLEMTSGESVFDMLVGSENFELSKKTLDDNRDLLGIVAHSDAPDSLIYFGSHAFFKGMYAAYADHRPFVLSPDAIWLLISQGFAQHVNANAEQLRSRFVNFVGKTPLLVVDSVSLDSPAGEWEKVFPKFTHQIAEFTGPELVETLTADFSTTTAVERVASQITIMEAMKQYFSYIHLRVGCGIPRITLLGTPEDWQRVLDKTRKLAAYDLKWWTDELEPLLEQFVSAAKGNVDTEFWSTMFKYHSAKNYAAPNIIDGWIVKFFPYDKNGRRNDLQQITSANNLPDEMVRADILHVDSYPDGTSVTTPLELRAGFIGLEQDTRSYTLTPRIGWLVRRKDSDGPTLLRSLEEQNASGEIGIRVDEIPLALVDALLKMKKIGRLTIWFNNRVVIPDALAGARIETLDIEHGRIDEADKQHIRDMFPQTKVTFPVWMTIVDDRPKPDPNMDQKIQKMEVKP